MNRQTLRDRVRRYNEAGVEGLQSRSRPGRTPFLAKQQMAELYELVVKGPDLAIAKVVRWRLVGVLEVVKRRFPVEVQHQPTLSNHRCATSPD